MTKLPILLFLSCAPLAAQAAGLPGAELSLAWGLPFVGILLSIALCPLFLPHFWHHHFGKVSAFWALSFLLPAVALYGTGVAGSVVAHALLEEFLPFIILLFALYTVSGGILISGNLHGSPRLNTGRLALGTLGSEATVVLTYPQALPAGTVYYKYGKTQDNPQPHWYPFPGAQVSGNTITLTLKDGGAGDDDLQQNRAIDDPGGPAQVAQVAASSPASIPTLGEWALALLAGVLGLFSLGALRRRV